MQTATATRTAPAPVVAIPESPRHWQRAAQIAADNPNLADRIKRAVAIVDAGQIKIMPEIKVYDDGWHTPEYKIAEATAHTQPAPYIITKRAGNGRINYFCTCKDFTHAPTGNPEINQKLCKHLIAYFLMREAQS